MNEQSSNTPIVITDLSTTGHVFATIVPGTKKYEDPRRLGRIYLDFGDGGEWIYRELVFVKDRHSPNYVQLVGIADSEKPNDELQLPPIGTVVVVLTIQGR